MQASRWLGSTWVAVLISAAVVVPRSVLISVAHSESYDDRYHIKRGLAFWDGTIASQKLKLNDPPLGEAILVLPIALVNLAHGYPMSEYRGEVDPTTLQSFALMVAAWKSILFCLGVGLAFHWCRRLYGLRSAWMVLLLLTFEPNLAAHIPIPALDIMGMDVVLLGCYLSWEFVKNPTRTRAVGLGAVLAFAILIKHTAIILPGITVLMALLQWYVRPWFATDPPELPPAPTRPQQAGQFIIVGVSGLIFLWTFLLFDRTTPLYYTRDGSTAEFSGHPLVRSILVKHLPAGVYVSSLIQAALHAKDGHASYMMGHKNHKGWWYYLPVVSLYKIPIGIGILILLTWISFERSPPRWEELGLVVPMLLWGLFLLNSRISIGFRHFFPCYLFILMFASRTACIQGRAWLATCSAALLLFVAHAASFHPNYLSYINFPRDKVYLEISDSNIDWGQSLKQVRSWVEAHPQPSRKLTLAYFGDITNDDQQFDRLMDFYFQDRLDALDEEAPMPTDGLLIISPVCVAGPYEPKDRFRSLQLEEPDEVIRGGMLVFDLDRIAERKRSSH